MNSQKLKLEVLLIFKHKFSLFVCVCFFLLFIYLGYIFFSPIYSANEIIITYGFSPFDICSSNPKLWFLIKKLYIFTFIFTDFIFCRFLYKRFFTRIQFFISSLRGKFFRAEDNSNVSITNKGFSLLIGKDFSGNKVYLPETGLYQNFLVTGTIGSGKTSSAIYPFVNQFLKYNSLNKKIGMLILDVKGNFYKYVCDCSKKYNLQDDIIVISLKNNVYYNPLHKPNLKPQILANRLKTILTLFSENNSESYWLDKAEQVLTECIKLCRLYNNGYVTFLELHKLVTEPDYYLEKISFLRNLFISNKLSNNQIYELNSSLNFFQKEFNKLDSRTKNILISEITRITNTFISDFDVYSTFCPEKNSLNFHGFEDAILNGKIVVLNINVSEYSLLSKIIATYLKLDFQTEVMSFLANGFTRKTIFICDEYDKFCTKTDGDFFSISREAKCINIVSTQSYSSLKSVLKDDASVKVIIQNLVNKIWFRTDDIFTIEEAQKQLGKEDKEKFSKSFSESAKETKFSYITNSLNSENSNISETFSTFMQSDFIFDTNFFTQNLETFSALVFLSDGNVIYKPKKIQMLPYFLN